MTREQEILTEIRKRLALVASDLRDYRVVLFGSRACGKARERSDFDVGVVGPRSLPLRTFHKIGDMLEEIPTLYHIDWVNLNETTDAFRREALKRVEVLHG